MSAPASFTIHYCPPEYPERVRPWRCRHEPQFHAFADLQIVRRKKRNVIEISHAVCLACGLSPGITADGRAPQGNVLVDLTMVAESMMKCSPEMWGRALALRERWVRIATYLFGPDGWTGQHERVARLIDPHLTMRITSTNIGKSSRRMAEVRFDESYLARAQ